MSTKTDGQEGVFAALMKCERDKPLTLEEIGALTGKSLSSVKRAISRKEIPKPKKFFGVLVLTPSAILQHLESRLENGKTEKGHVMRKLGLSA